MITDPLSSAWYLATSSIRSALFLSLFPTIYMTVVCLYKSKTRLPFHRYMYWLAGIFGSSSIFIERSGRKFELAMFALPRALQSVANIGVANGFLPNMSTIFPIVSFSISMGVIMTAYDVERDLLVPTMQSALGWIFPHYPKLPKGNSSKLIEKRNQKRLLMKKNGLGLRSGKYVMDALEINISPRIEEVLEYENDSSGVSV